MRTRFYFFVAGLLLPIFLLAALVSFRRAFVANQAELDWAIFAASWSSGCACALKCARIPDSELWLEDHFVVGMLYLLIYGPVLAVCYLIIASWKID